MKLIVGLGNPGKKYNGTRHNIGRELVEATARFHGAPDFKREKKFKGLFTETRINNEKVAFLLPETFMNSSGESVRATTDFYKISPSDVLIVQDEMDFDPLQFAFVNGGGASGHNGIKSVYAHFSDEVDRFRVGVGRPEKDGKPSDKYVLQCFSAFEKMKLAFLKGKMIDAISDWATEGLTKAMNMWNGVR